MAVDQKVDPVKSKKDRWEKADIILRPVGALITALTIAFVSYAASNYLSKNQEKEAKTKLYTELMTKREDSESALRKDMFNSIMNNILKDKETVSLDEKILQLELLTYNFHESLNLMPLFEYLNRRNNMETKGADLKKAYKGRLIKMSRAIIAKQLSSLEAVSKPVPFTFEDTLFTSKNSKAYLNDSEFECATPADRHPSWQQCRPAGQPHVGPAQCRSADRRAGRPAGTGLGARIVP